MELVVFKKIADRSSSVLDNSIEKARILGLSKRLQVNYGVGYSIIQAIAEGQGIQWIKLWNVLQNKLYMELSSKVEPYDLSGYIS